MRRAQKQAVENSWITTVSLAKFQKVRKKSLVVESNTMSPKYCPLLLLLATVLWASFVSASSREELIVNGGFESYFDGWQPYVYDQVYGRVNVTSGTSHSGSWCLRSYINPVRAIPYSQKRGGGVMQTLSTDIKDLDILLSFWVMPAVIGQNSHTNIRSVIRMELKDGRSLSLSYYVAWAPPALGEFLYNTSDNTIFFLPGLLHQWTYVQREVKRDFESGFGSSSGVALARLTASFEMTTVSHLSTPDAFWDDISVVAETVPSTPAPTPTQTTTPPPKPSPPTQSPTITPPSATSPPAATSKETEGKPVLAIESYAVPLLLVVVLVGLAIVAVRARSRKGVKAEAAKKYCLNCGAEIAVEAERCTHCGSKQ